MSIGLLRLMGSLYLLKAAYESHALVAKQDNNPVQVLTSSQRLKQQPGFMFATDLNIQQLFQLNCNSVNLSTHSR